MNSDFETVSLAEEVVGDAWRAFIRSEPPLVSVPAFLSWLGGHQPDVLRVVREKKLVEVADRLFARSASRSSLEHR